MGLSMNVTVISESESHQTLVLSIGKRISSILAVSLKGGER